MPSALRRSRELQQRSNTEAALDHRSVPATCRTFQGRPGCQLGQSPDFQSFGIAAAIYLSSFLSVGLFRLAERRWLSFLGPDHKFRILNCTNDR